MKAEIIAIDLGSHAAATGQEHAGRLSDRLADAGIELVTLTHVRANERDIEDCLHQALRRSRLLIMTGGGEDLAKKSLSRILDRRLILQSDLLRQVEEQYARAGKQPPAGYEKTALMPYGARAVLGRPGRPSGFFLEQKGHYILYLTALPGDIADELPEELIGQLRSRARPRRWTSSSVLRSYGLDEARVTELIKDASVGECQVSLCTGRDGVDIKLTASGPTAAAAAAALEESAKTASEKLGDYCYATGEYGMEQAVAALLTDKKLTIATAESCTGGLIAKRLTDVPGSTAYMERGVVTYSNLSKSELIGVPEETITAHGAVSKETAEAMAEGIRWNARTDLGLSVTGIAGPTGGTPEKPVGLVYIALATEDGVTAKACNFTGGREDIRYATSQRALDMVRRYLLA